MKKVFKILLIFLPVVFSTCTKTMTESENFSLTGKVTLEGQAAHNGITVALYPLAVLDTAIVNMQKSYPTIGVQISQATEFDHRLSEPVYQTTTDKDGNYVLESIAPAEYNLVVEKKGFGWRYFYNVNNTTKPKVIELLPEIQVQGTLGNYTVWNENQHYIVTDNITIPENATLIIDKGAILRINKNVLIDVRGNLQLLGSENDPIQTIGNSNLNEMIMWEGIRCNDVSSKVEIQRVYVRNLSDGLLVNDGNCTIKNCSFNSMNNPILIGTGGRAFIEKCHFANNSNSSIQISSASDITISNNFFVGNCVKGQDGISLYSSSGTFKNNIIFRFYNGIYQQNKGDMVISNNLIRECDVGISLKKTGLNSTYINNNTIQDCNNTLFLLVRAIPIVNYNNLLQKNNEAYIKTTETWTDEELSSDIDFTNNFWGTIQSDLISPKIVDKRKSPTNILITGELLFAPFLKEVNANAYPL